MFPGPTPYVDILCNAMFLKAIFNISKQLCGYLLNSDFIFLSGPLSAALYFQFDNNASVYAKASFTMLFENKACF